MCDINLEKIYKNEEIFERLNSLKRSKISLSILFKNGSYISPELEDDLIKFMKENEKSDYPLLHDKFKIPIPIIQRIRQKYKFSPIKKKSVNSFQNILKKEGKRKCPVCLETKSLNDWYENYLSRCKTCDKEFGRKKFHIKQNTQLSLNDFLLKKIKESKIRKKSKSNPDLYENNLTLENLLELYKKQDGKCFYSGRKLETTSSKKSPNSLSIDRIDSSRGYTIDNICLCCSVINLMKSNHSKDLFINICKDISEFNFQNPQHL